MTDDKTDARNWFEKHFHRTGEYDVLCDKVCKRSIIDVYGDCRVNPQYPPTEIKYKFRSVTGNFCLRGVTLVDSLANMPEHVGGVAALSWTSNLPMLNLVHKKYAVLLFADTPTDLKNRLAIIDKYRNREASKKTTLDAQKDLIDSGFVGNAGC